MIKTAETMRITEGGWTDKALAFAQLRVVCEVCYFQMKEINLKQG